MHPHLILTIPPGFPNQCICVGVDGGEPGERSAPSGQFISSDRDEELHEVAPAY